MSNSLECLALVGRHHNVDIRPELVLHDWALKQPPTDLQTLSQISRKHGLKSKVVGATWQNIENLGQAFPVICKSKDGVFFILVGVQKSDESCSLVVLDSEQNEFTNVSAEEFENRFEPQILLTKKKYKWNDQSQPFGLRWFIPEILRSRKAVGDLFIAAVVVQFFALLTPLFFQIVIDKVLVNDAYSTLRTLGLGLCIVLLFDAILNFLQQYLLQKVSNRLDIMASVRSFGHLMSLPREFFDRATAGVLSKHMQQTVKIREFLTGSLFTTFLQCIGLVIFLPLLVFYSWQLFLVVLFFSGCIATVIACLLIPYRSRLEKLYAVEADRQATLVETIQGMTTVKALSLEPVQKKKWNEQCAAAIEMQFEVGKISISAQTLSKLLEKLMTVAVVWIGAESIFAGQLSIGALVAFQMIAGRVTAPLVQIVSLVHEYQETALSIKMLGNILNASPEQRANGGLCPNIEGRIEFDRVNFKYEGASRNALDDVVLRIPAGKVVGIVGKSGCGKTTLTRMLQGLYVPNSGVIRFDSVDMREIDIGHLRRNISVVLQENFLFKGTIRENIAATCPTAPYERIVECARLAGATEFIEQLPQTYDTLIEENGANLSGGQRQRLAIARALVADPKILIFDEATSALDPESEAIIQHNLQQIAKGRTVIIVSHRLSTLTDADGIVVLDQGAVVGVGPHRHLLENCNQYADLWNNQIGVSE